MLLGEALATCPSLRLVEQDPAEAEQAWEEIVCRLEGEGFAVEPAEPGCLYVETRAVERLYGGVEGVLRRAPLPSAPAGMPVRAQPSESSPRSPPRASPARARYRRRERGDAHLPRSAPARRPAARAGGPRRARGARPADGRPPGSVAGCGRCRAPGAGGRQAWHLARGGDRGRVRPRRPAAEIAEYLEFPEPMESAPAGAASTRRAGAQPSGAGGTWSSQGRASGEARWRRLLAAHAHPP